MEVQVLSAASMIPRVLSPLVFFVSSVFLKVTLNRIINKDHKTMINHKGTVTSLITNTKSYKSSEFFVVIHRLEVFIFPQVPPLKTQGSNDLLFYHSHLGYPINVLLHFFKLHIEQDRIANASPLVT